MAVTRAASRAGSGNAKTVTAKNSETTIKAGASREIDRTADGHYIIVNNRKWRATDPMIPTEELKELKHFLAIGRGGSRKSSNKSNDQIEAARKYTGLAKLGLGERGQPPWWQDSDDARQQRWKQALQQLRELEKP